MDPTPATPATEHPIPASAAGSSRGLARFLRSRRLWIYGVVVAVWIGMISQLWVREVGRGGDSLKKIGISPEVLLVAWTDYEQWLWIEQAGRRIGLTRLRIPPARTESADAGAPRQDLQYVMQARTRVNLPVMGVEIPADLGYQVTMNTAFEMDALQGVLRVAGQAFQIQAFAENRYLYYRVKFDASSTSGSLPGGLAATGLGSVLGLLGPMQKVDLCGRSPLAEPIFMIDAVIPVLTRSTTLKAGDRWVTRAANPLSGAGHTDVRVTVEAKEMLRLDGIEVDTWRLTEAIGPVQSTAWYNTQGVMVQGEMGPGLRLVQAKASQGVQAYPDFRKDIHFSTPLDREWIRRHLDPKLDGKPLKDMLPTLPGFL